MRLASHHFKRRLWHTVSAFCAHYMLFATFLTASGTVSHTQFQKKSNPNTSCPQQLYTTLDTRTWSSKSCALKLFKLRPMVFYCTTVFGSTFPHSRHADITSTLSFRRSLLDCSSSISSRSKRYSSKTAVTDCFISSKCCFKSFYMTCNYLR